MLACGFTDDETLLRLQKCLQSKTLEAVCSRLLHPAQPPRIVSTMQMLFGKPEIIINSLLLIGREPPLRADKLETISTH